MTEQSSEILGDSPAIARLRDRLAKVATTPLPVLLIGETGTGKEVAARELHKLSGRRGRFLPVDCAALSESLVESELFGHERGAFTGATSRSEGLVWAARGGTFFLDEIGELPLAVQTRLLRLLEAGTYRPVGAESERDADIRVVAATWRDLSTYVSAGRFRRDLYHRLAVVELRLPPLRDRREDIDVLLAHFLAEAAGDRRPPDLPDALRAHLRALPWPGNARELRNAAQYLAAMTRGPRAAFSDLPPRLQRAPASPAADVIDDALLRTDLPYMDARRVWLDAFQLRYIRALLDENDGNVSATARAAGMDRRSIQRILTRARGSGPEDADLP